MASWLGPDDKTSRSGAGTLLLDIVVMIIIALSGSPRSFAAAQATDISPWLQAHVGTGEGQIAPVLLQRARALYLKKVSEGAVNNPCYFAMDATRPSASRSGRLGRRFYIIWKPTSRSARFRRATAVGAI